MRSTNLAGSFLLYFVLTAAFSLARAQELSCDVYVDGSAPESGDGLSWGSAYSELRHALDAVGEPEFPTNVCVAAGAYAPAASPANVSFELRRKVNLYGGFEGDEPMPVDLTARNFGRNRTVLTGLGASDSVLRCGAAACDEAIVMDGFTVTGGIAGMTGGPTLNGGGLFNVIGDLTLSNVTFVGNHALGQGGAIFNIAGSLTLSNVVLDRNDAYREGGGIYNHSGMLAISNAVFVGNSVRSGGGGGIYTLARTDLSNAVFLENSADYGAVVVAAHWFTLTNSIAWANPSSEGPQIFVNPGLAKVAYSIVEDNAWANNTAYAGIANTDADPLFRNAADPDGPDDVWGTEDDGLVLLPQSPAIDAGTSEGVLLPALDILGRPRVAGLSVDTGPYEFDPSGVSTGILSSEQPDGFLLKQNYPNPFNPSTRITFSLPDAARARLAVYDMLGHEVGVLVDGTLPSGDHEISFDAAGLPSGVYSYTLQTGDLLLQRRMVLAK